MAAQSKGYEQWAKIHNLKQAAKKMNFLTEHKIEPYADLVSRIEEMAAESGQAADGAGVAAVLHKHFYLFRGVLPCCHHGAVSYTHLVLPVPTSAVRGTE